MGHVFQDVVVSSEKSKKVRMFVDTGAIFSVISPDLAKQLGVTPAKRKHRVVLADGKSLKLKVGLAFFRIDAREVANTVLIGDVDEPILGVETLEALGLAVDPASGSLRETRSFAVRLGGWR